MAELLAPFPARYTVEEGPFTGRGPVSLTFAAVGSARPAPAVEVFVQSDAGSSWHGSFFGSADALDLLATTPDPARLLVVAGGVVYFVPVDEPEAYVVVPLRPVREVHSAVDQGLLLLAGYSELLAIGSDGGVRWKASRLASDGFAEVRVASSTVVVRGYSAADGREVETTVDLARGSVLSRD